MIDHAANAAVARVGVSLHELYEAWDPDFLLFVDAVCGQVAHLHEEARRRNA